MRRFLLPLLALLFSARAALAVPTYLGEICTSFDPGDRLKSTFNGCNTYAAGDTVLLCVSAPDNIRSMACYDNDTSGHRNIWHAERSTPGYGVNVKGFCASAINIPAGSNWDKVDCYFQQSNDPTPPLTRAGGGMRFSGVNIREPGDRYWQAKGDSTHFQIPAPGEPDIPRRKWEQAMLVFVMFSQTSSTNFLSLNSPWPVVEVTDASVGGGQNHRIDMAHYKPADQNDNEFSHVSGDFDTSVGFWIGTVIVLSEGPAPQATPTPFPTSPTPTPLSPLVSCCPNQGALPRPTFSTCQTLYDVPAGDSIVLGLASNSRGAFIPAANEALFCLDEVGNSYGLDGDRSVLPPTAYDRASMCASLKTTTLLPAGSDVTFHHGPSGNTCMVGVALPRQAYNIIPTTIPNPTPERTPGVSNGLWPNPTPGANGNAAVADGQDFRMYVTPLPTPANQHDLLVAMFAQIAPSSFETYNWDQAGKPARKVAEAIYTDGLATVNRQAHMFLWTQESPTPSDDGMYGRRMTVPTPPTPSVSDQFNRIWAGLVVRYPMGPTRTLTFTPTRTPTQTPTFTPTNTPTLAPGAPTFTNTVALTATPSRSFTPSPTPTWTPAQLAYDKVLGAATSATPWPAILGPVISNAVAIQITTPVAANSGKAVVVGFTAPDQDCWPFSAYDTNGNVYGWDAKSDGSGLRGGQLMSVNPQGGFTAGTSYIIVRSCVGNVASGCSAACSNTVASRNAAAVLVSGIKLGTGPNGSTNPTPATTPGVQNAASIDECNGNSGTSQHPSSDVYPPKTPGVNGRRIIIGSISGNAAEPTLGFCGAQQTPATPGSGLQKCIGTPGIATPMYQYPTPTPASGQLALPRIGTTSFGQNRVLDVEVIVQSGPTPVAATLDGYFFRPGSTSSVSKAWVAPSCSYLGAVP